MPGSGFDTIIEEWSHKMTEEMDREIINSLIENQSNYLNSYDTNLSSSPDRLLSVQPMSEIPSSILFYRPRFTNTRAVNTLNDQPKLPTAAFCFPCGGFGNHKTGCPEKI